MKRAILMLALLFGSHAALAQCNPPAGLGPQQWYSICGPLVQQMYANGMAGNMPFEMFAQQAYGQYLQMPSPMMSPMAPQMAGPSPGLQQCPMGASQCFSGWYRECKQVGNGTMWITGARRC